ncbi:MAG TPA: hypothetical protein VJM50_05340 [Pyrinomonadaceae bacterium]|nr:hypothetical protein [Pyrinomonadaceae bacterium]
MLLTLILLAQFFITAQEQNSSAGVAPVEVLEVEVLMREVKATRVRDPRNPPPPGPVDATDIPGVRPKPDSRQQPTISDRSRELREAGRRTVEQPVPARSSEDRYIYYYRVRLKNTSPKKIKSILWEYQLLDGSDSTILAQRFFFCAVTIKAHSEKVLQPGTVSPPSRVINADNPDDSAQKQRVVVNQIEYSDGSIWMRDGWTQDDLTRIDTTRKVRDIRDNQCALL